MIPRYSKCPTKHNGPPIGLTSEAGTDEYEVHQEIERICQHTMEEIECDWCDQAHAASSSTDLNHPWTSIWLIHGHPWNQERVKLQKYDEMKNSQNLSTHVTHVPCFLISYHRMT
jgi:hypothetical protein